MPCKQCGATVKSGQYASSTEKESKLCPDCWNKPFQITSVCRADLQEILTGEEIAKLDDGDMQEIASKMADAYCDNVFWIDLEIIAEYVLEDKTEL